MNVCAVCDKELSTAPALRRHLQRIHKEDASSIKKFFNSSSYSEFICPICAKDQGYRQDLIVHLTDIHSIIFEKECFTFSTEMDFVNWKTDIENQTSCRYTKRHGTHTLKDGSQVYRYQCNRSGIYRSRSKEIRRTETVKMNAYCPAEIFVKKLNNSFYVKFVKNHIGHSCDLQSLPTRQVTSFIKKKNNYVCPVCKDALGNKKDFHYHLINNHSISLDTETFHFASSEQFHEWKTNIEKICRLRFVKSQGKKNKDGYEQPYFCNYSKLHYFRHSRINKTKRKRFNKTFRMDVSCPAEIKTFVKNGIFDVSFIGTHIGHPVGKENEKSYTQNRKKSYVCPLCLDPVLSKEQYHSHLKQIHNKVVETQKINFTSEQELEDWKKTTEAISGCRFILKRTSYVNNRGYEHSHFYCNQSEISINKHSKETENIIDNLIFPLCPAEFIVRNEKGSINVEFVKTHVGHMYNVVNTCNIVDATEDNSCDDRLVDNIPDQLQDTETVNVDKEIDFDFLSGSFHVSTVVKPVIHSFYAVADTQQQLNKHTCPECQTSVLSKQQLSDHLFLKHDIRLETENLSFASDVEFNVWKSTMEKLTNSTYMLKDSQYCNDSKVEFLKYQCTKKSASKDDVSLKICPAEIGVQKYENTFSVEFIRTHVGHASISPNLQITEVKSLGIMEEIGINLTKHNDVIQTEEIKTSADYFVIVARVPKNLL